MWQKTLGSTNDDEAVAIVQNGTGHYLIGCGVLSADGDFPSQVYTWLLNIDNAGNGLRRTNYAHGGGF